MGPGEEAGCCPWAERKGKSRSLWKGGSEECPEGPRCRVTGGGQREGGTQGPKERVAWWMEPGGTPRGEQGRGRWPRMPSGPQRKVQRGGPASGSPSQGVGKEGGHRGGCRAAPAALNVVAGENFSARLFTTDPDPEGRVGDRKWV